MNSFDLLNGVVRSNSEDNPSAQYSTLCAGEKANTMSKSEQIFCDCMANKHDFYFSVVFCVQFLSAARVSEVLSISSASLGNNGYLRISAIKGSSDRAVNIAHLPALMLKIKSLHSPIRQYYSRFAYYRDCQRNGIGATFQGNNKMSITHYLRHAKALAMHQDGVDTTIIAQILGHKNLKSTKFYEKPEKP